ncbi:MAG: hypothetical protein ACLQGV_01710 [Bryobacteraceae bacterium]
MGQRLRPSVADPHLKTTRAKVHLDALRKELHSFCESKPYSFVREEDIEHGRYRIRVDIGAIPDSIFLIAGDLLYCLRSSLDQLVFALAHLTVPYPEDTQFPILAKDIASDKDTRKRFEKQTHGVPTEAVRIIESLQPYHGGNAGAIRSHLLWRLNWLGNIDKHRRIPLHGGEIVFAFPFLPKASAPMIEFDHDNGVISVPIGLKSQMALDPTVSFEVVFGDLSDGIACNFNGIEQIYNFVAEDVIPRFARFFS